MQGEGLTVTVQVPHVVSPGPGGSGPLLPVPEESFPGIPSTAAPPVQAPPGALPTTGAALLTLVLVAALLFLVGAALVRHTRRFRPEPQRSAS